ncbi:hypothetical protein HBA54_14380 [Pelagibius litoralis]|uniref:TIGR02300 family protein n=1 Tax=Pelagibius litoralis TaxID=374515 RepID=A0A967EYI5_9PROT|nr:hypothetical protein [Pelagibius litoralis]
MNRLDRGRKHACPDCACKYYDLGKKDANCPKCGAKQAAPKMPRGTRLAKKTGGMPYRRYP